MIKQTGQTRPGRAETSAQRERLSIKQIDRAIGQRLSACRKAAGLSEDALAMALGVSLKQLQKFEEGEGGVTAARLVRAAGALEVDVAVLLGHTALVGADDGLLERFFASPAALVMASAFVRLDRENQQVLAELAAAMAW